MLWREPSISNTGVVNRLGYRLLSMAHRAGAECLVVACPLCQFNLDFRQLDAKKNRGDLPEMPVLYITQLLGLALGLSPDALGLGGSRSARHVCPPNRPQSRPIPAEGHRYGK